MDPGAGAAAAEHRTPFKNEKEACHYYHYYYDYYYDYYYYY